ncbi:GNAT family N-acetyltransferase [Moritella marina ATCC 15381]|uniref:GNAT family N-acetyltransferase n=1 Tax=Moritella marina ATCC 15381 TaxID=1202962 RepID=A0A5J6WH31_MORMI|nr:GNAT family protein [Moritella marina]QFI37389.1 GNAT family N-acetyltransferase [Moritella marina ATCC 15381]
MENVVLKPTCPDELAPFYNLITRDELWTKFNGPYFPYSKPTLTEFKNGLFSNLCEGEKAQAIMVNGVPVGSVSFYWECESTRWLEAGVVIYDPKYWGQGLGYKALIHWVTHLFSTLNIERVGLTTWSGNLRMMACAEKLGFKQEACIRKVRYYQGEYYDSIKYGVLRSEWIDRH